MKNVKLNQSAVCALLLCSGQVFAGDNIISDFLEGSASGSLRLRAETVDIDKTPTVNTEDDGAQAVTLRTRLVYTTNGVNGFNMNVEFEDVHALEVNDYNVPGGFGNGDPNYAVIADPESTELNEAYLRYKKDAITFTAGRQRIKYDNVRFVGDVGWRQDDQTYDAYKLDYAKDALAVSLAFIDQVNGTFGDEHITNVSDTLVNASYNVEGLGKFTGYSYMFENDSTDATQDTAGIRFAGKQGGDIPFTYALEYASQTADAGVEYDATYTLVELGTTISAVSLTVGNETLGSDDGAYGFSTDLATKHAFNGWADMFLNTPNDGLVDTYVKVGGKVAGTKLLAVYHVYSADESTPTDEYGSELDASAVKKLESGLTVGAKLAMYSADDFGADTNKFWVWTQVNF